MAERLTEAQRAAAKAKDPGFGKRYGGAAGFVTGRGVRVWMWRKGQRVRFFDAKGRQHGPEQDNVAPAVAFAHASGWLDMSLPEWMRKPAIAEMRRNVAEQKRAGRRALEGER